jgi:hypothetical protein
MSNRRLKISSDIDRWLTAPENNAAGRLGLFRILYSIFYLWHLSFHFAENLSGMAEQHHLMTVLIEWARPYTLAPWVLRLAECVLAAAVVVLMFGYRTRLATLVVLVLGSIYEAWWVSIDSEHAAVLLAAHIPFFMCLNGRWGETYSLDALLRRRAGQPTVDPSDSSGWFFLPARAVLVVLAALFFSSAFFKLGPGGTWLEERDLTANFLLEKNVTAARDGIPVNYLAPLIARNRWLAEILHFSVILFEASVVLALFSRKLRDLLLSTALIFHAVNGLWLAVTFTAVIIVYALFIDLQTIRERLLPRRLLTLNRVPSGVLIAGTFLIALAVGALWDSHLSPRSIVNLGGWLDWRRLWYPVLPFILIWWVRSLGRLIRPATPVRAAELVCAR